ncbi:hypothetical protein JX265_012306 [Neoarthrinium moseri]|uniref:Fe2OG dioxygenase domain-containing protein n=1 Tax=Neoarthrinium moseri TaxID=1658444 RepID=A0A9P9WB73_9PEZI|nr:uncharacterized protein JN550_004379 [Neoarthrinium moseri]KAI1851281.1 hypothetical protein JX266_003356 [Neoarthrinium moseri]KAI1855118.1 hypothetical protein JX265_012306 [Neoarthrinium moseri]KAI1871385.1 hypothetical protein JN550_004379 [Neoarthrinium moseri]
MPSATSTSSFYLPLVDISPFLEDSQSPAAQKVVKDVTAACKSTGFFQIRGHGVPAQLRRALFEASRNFFALPLGEKIKLDARKNVGFRGYDVMESQSYEPGADAGLDVVRDMKEGFFASTDFPLDHPRVKSGRFLQGPNVWPAPELIAHEQFGAVIEDYRREMLRLSRVVLDLIAATLPYGPHVFDELLSDDPMCLVRLLHYPPDPPTNGKAGKNQLGSGEHTDFGIITLLLQDDHPGLEVLDEETGAWVGVPPQEDVYIVNIADMMSMLTAGDYKSSVHRVRNQGEEDRYSVVFFFDGKLDYKLKRLDGHDDVDEAGRHIPTVEEHAAIRMTGSYRTVVA